jgi:hypothetical protein
MMLSEILQGYFSKIGNSSLQIMYHMAVPELTKKEKERREGKSRMSNSKILHFLFVLEAYFQKSCKDVSQKLGICLCKLYIS